MCIGLFLGYVVSVVCCNQRDLVFLRPLNQYGIDPFLVFLSVPHQLDVEILTKLFMPPKQGFFRLGISHIQYFGGYLSVKVSGQYYQIFFVLGNNLLINPWHIIKPIGIG